MFTSTEETEIVRIALKAELNGYQDEYIKDVIRFTKNDLSKIHDLYLWLCTKRHVRALNSLYLELLLFSSDAINPMYFHELERI